VSKASEVKASDLTLLVIELGVKPTNHLSFSFLAFSSCSKMNGDLSPAKLAFQDV